MEHFLAHLIEYLITAGIAVTIIAAWLLWRKLNRIAGHLEEMDSSANDLWNLITQNPGLDVDGKSAPQLMNELYGSK